MPRTPEHFHGIGRDGYEGAMTPADWRDIAAIYREDARTHDYFQRIEAELRDAAIDADRKADDATSH